MKRNFFFAGCLVMFFGLLWWFIDQAGSELMVLPPQSPQKLGLQTSINIIQLLRRVLNSKGCDKVIKHDITVNYETFIYAYNIKYSLKNLRKY